MKLDESDVCRPLVLHAKQNLSDAAQERALELDPDFPSYAAAMAMPEARHQKGQRREGAWSTVEWLVEGRGWRRYSTWYLWGPGEIGETSEQRITAIHPEWELVLYRRESSGSSTECWSRLHEWEAVTSDGGVFGDLVGLAEVLEGFAQARLISGQLRLQSLVSINVPIRLHRDGHLRWQGMMPMSPSSRHASLPIKEGEVFHYSAAPLPFEVEAGDVLEAYAVADSFNQDEQ